MLAAVVLLVPTGLTSVGFAAILAVVGVTRTHTESRPAGMVGQGRVDQTSPAAAKQADQAAVAPVQSVMAAAHGLVAGWSARGPLNQDARGNHRSDRWRHCPACQRVAGVALGSAAGAASAVRARRCAAHWAQSALCGRPAGHLARGLAHDDQRPLPGRVRGAARGRQADQAPTATPAATWTRPPGTAERGSAPRSRRRSGPSSPPRERRTHPGGSRTGSASRQRTP